MTIFPDIYINAASMVCCRRDPFADRTPLEGYQRAVEPDTAGILRPMEARRLSRLLRRALFTSRTVAPDGADAVITATAMGCWENSERFLTDIRDGGEQLLKPTLFMQSTHNTPGSVIAVNMGCRGYNNTWSQGVLSFEYALMDAVLTLGEESGAENVIVGAHDELTPAEAEIMRRGAPAGGFVSEASVSMLVSRHAGVASCRIDRLSVSDSIDDAGPECDLLVLAGQVPAPAVARIAAQSVINSGEIVGHTLTPSAPALYIAYKTIVDGGARTASVVTADGTRLSLIHISGQNN